MNTVEQPLIVADNLVKHFPVAGSRLRRERHVVHALDGVSLNINAGEVLGLVGESGCGKTTLGRCILRLIELTDGRVLFDERDLAQVKGTALRSLRAEMQIVFQNPYSSLNPRMRVEAILQEPLRTHRVPVRRMAQAHPHAVGTGWFGCAASGSLPARTLWRAVPARRNRAGAQLAPALDSTGRTDLGA